MPDQKEEEKRSDAIAEFREGNISLILDSYDDIFSDFDPRNYSEKALSDDFLIECKKAARDKDDRPELRFLIPKKKRNYRDELRIKKRLKEHFQRHFKEKEKEIKSMRIRGGIWFAIGAILMILGTFFYKNADKSFLLNLLFIIIEPAGWFFFWEGLNMIFLMPRDKISDYEFYRKMARSEIFFLDY